MTWASVLLSVRLSVTLLYCIKMVQAKITKFSLWAAPRTLVYRDKILCPWVKGVLLERGRQRKVPTLKKRYFAAIGSSSVETLQIDADMLLIITSTGHWFFNFINIDDLLLLLFLLGELLSKRCRRAYWWLVARCPYPWPSSRQCDLQSSGLDVFINCSEPSCSWTSSRWRERGGYDAVVIFRWGCTS